MENVSDNVTFEEILIRSFKEVKVGTTVTAKIIEINSKGEIFVDLGYKSDGIIPRKEYSIDLDADPNKDFKVGDEIQADIIKLNDGQGNVLMSYKRAKLRNVKKQFNEKVKNKEIFTEKVKSINDSGLIVNYQGLIRIFIPMSLSGIPRDEDTSSYIGKEVSFRVIENDLRTGKVIGSIKELADEKRKIEKEKFWNEIEVGKHYKGTVSSLSDYGAFVDVGGAQGLLHISEMSWNRNDNPRNIFKVGQEINVTIKELDKENKRFKLSYDDKGENPWTKAKEKYHVGDVIKVRVSKLMPFGAFVELENGIEGLVHISQICERKIAKPEEELKENQEVNAKIIDIDEEKQKIELSIRELEGTSFEYKGE